MKVLSTRSCVCPEKSVFATTTLSDGCKHRIYLTSHFLVTHSITKRLNCIVAEITFAIPNHNSSLIHTTIIFCLATRQKQSIKINHLNNHKHVVQCADITSPNDFANESLKVVGSRARSMSVRSNQAHNSTTLCLQNGTLNKKK